MIYHAKKIRQFKGFRRACALACLIASVPHASNQSLGFIVGHHGSMHFIQSQYSARPTVEKNADIKDSDFIAQGLESQQVESLLPSATEYDKAVISAESRNASVQLAKIRAISSQEPHPFPFSMIVDKQEIKHALLLSAVDPNIGVLISGGRGTAKSVLARSMKQIVPRYIRRIEGSEYNIDPDGIFGVDSFLLHELKENNYVSLENLPSELVPTPFVQIPLGCAEDSLIGTVDLEQSIETGVAKFCPGLLAKSHRG